MEKIRFKGLFKMQKIRNPCNINKGHMFMKISRGGDALNKGRSARKYWWGDWNYRYLGMRLCLKNISKGKI